MTELLTAAQMRAIEQEAIDSGEVTGLELMERAGQGVVEAIFEEWPELGEDGAKRGAAPRPEASPRTISAKVKRAVVLCGPGNNGGDGFVVARLLHERDWAVEVFLYGDPEKLPPDARVNYERWCALGEVRSLTADCLSSCYQPDLVLDAVFGTGIRRQLPPEVQGVFHWLLHHRRDWKQDQGYKRRAREKIVAVDLSSGVCSDSGHLLGASCEEEDLALDKEPSAWPYEMARAAMAELTVTFHTPKLCHHLNVGVGYSGKVKTVDIGLRGEALEKGYGILCAPDTERVRLLEPSFYWRALPRKTLLSPMVGKSDAHKFHHGHCLVLSGGVGKTGAARLSARGALRVGAGLVTLGVPPSAQQEAASQLTAIMLKRVGDAEALTDVLQDKRITALCLGPALGLDRAKSLVAAALDAGLEARPTVLDADALSAFEDDPKALFTMLHEKCVLTPHGGEFARLFPDISEKLNVVPTEGPAYSKVDATRAAAKRAGCVVLYKGADTVIAAPDGRCSINSAHYERSAPWLATAGSGDVLAGFITGLMARGFQPMQAAETAAWLHVECALKFGPGLIAEDLPEQLPAVFRDLGL